MESEALLRLMEIGARDRILELHCGTGELSVLLAARAPDGLVAALDPSEENIRSARARGRVVDNIMFLADSEPQIPWKEDFFSKALSHGWPANLADVYRVLSPGGKLFVLAKNDCAEDLRAVGFSGIGRSHAVAFAEKR